MFAGAGGADTGAPAGAPGALMGLPLATAPPADCTLLTRDPATALHRYVSDSGTGRWPRASRSSDRPMVRRYGREYISPVPYPQHCSDAGFSSEAGWPQSLVHGV